MYKTPTIPRVLSLQFCHHGKIESNLISINNPSKFTRILLFFCFFSLAMHSSDNPLLYAGALFKIGPKVKEQIDVEQ